MGALVTNTSQGIASEYYSSQVKPTTLDNKYRGKSVITGRELGTYWVLWLPTQARVSMSGKIRADLATPKDDIRCAIYQYLELRGVFWAPTSCLISVLPPTLYECIYTMVYQNCISVTQRYCRISSKSVNYESSMHSMLQAVVFCVDL